MSHNPALVQPYAAAVRKLLMGVLYHDDAAWSQLLDHRLAVQDYLAHIGLELCVDEIGGCAYLHDATRDPEQQSSTLPTLTSRRALSFYDTLLLVLLRERMDEHERRDLDGARLRLRIDEISEMLQPFVRLMGDERKFEGTVTTSVNRLKTMGFLTERRDTSLEVRAVVRTKLKADELADIKNRLMRYIEERRQGQWETQDDELV